MMSSSLSHGSHGKMERSLRRQRTVLEAAVDAVAIIVVVIVLFLILVLVLVQSK
jgi:hypothetical protein